MIYLSYFLGNLAIMYARARKGWPVAAAPFSLKGWGPIVNVLGLVYGGAMLVNFAWPRAASNPTPNQTNGALGLGIGWLDRIPILYTVSLGIVLIGAIYYFAVERGRPLPIDMPSEEGPFVIPADALPPDEI